MLKILLLAAIPVAYAQQFEAASIRRSKAVDGNSNWSTRGVRFTANAIRIRTLIAWIYDIREFQVSGGPSWISSDGYDIVAAAGGEKEPSEAEFREMLKSLLAERFGFQSHGEKKEMQAYAMIPSPRGLHLTEDASPSGNFSMRQGHIDFAGVPLTAVAQALAGVLDRPVVDQSGTTAHYTGKLDWAPGPGAEGPSLFTAIEEQLGLKLDGRRMPVEMIVIDRLNRPSEN